MGKEGMPVKKGNAKILHFPIMWIKRLTADVTQVDDTRSGGCRDPHMGTGFDRSAWTLGGAGMKHLLLVVTLFSFSLISGRGAHAQQLGDVSADTSTSSVPNHTFYRPDLNFGSVSVMGPLNVLLNRGFSILHFRDQPRDLGQFPWGDGFAAVYDQLVHPRRGIERAGGWGPWFKREFVPTTRVWEWAWAPNYAGHVIAGGITYRYLEEWFEAHGVPAPALSSAVYLMGTMVANEAIEHRDGTGSGAGVADLLFFDPLGIILFRIDGVARFFQKELHAADWSPQVSVTLPSGRVQNVSQVIAYKIPLPFLERTRLLLTLGHQGLTGVTYRFDNGLSLGVAGGIDGDVRLVDPETGHESIDPRPAGGVYLDRDDSLLVSVVVGYKAYNFVSVNVYPGVLPGRFASLGFWATMSQDREFSLGLSSRSTLGLGTGVDWNRR